MADNNFQPIFDYIDRTKQELKEELASKADIANLQKTVDGIANNFKKNDEKVTIVEAKAERLESWVMNAAEKTDIPYEP